MATYHIRYLTTRPGKRGSGPRYFWQPSTELIKAGWKAQRLSDNEHEARLEAERWNANLDRWRQGLQGEQLVDAQSGSVEALIRDYKQTRFWNDLKPKTQNGCYEYAFRIIRPLLGDLPVTAITPMTVQTVYESLRGDKPAKAATVVRVLRVLMSYAVQRRIVMHNPAARPRINEKSRKGSVWTPEQVQCFVQTADELKHFTIGTAIILNEWMGQRPADVLELLLADYADGRIGRVQNKTGAHVSLPVDLVPALKQRLAEQIKRNSTGKLNSLYLLPNEYGQPYSLRRFAELVQEIRTRAAAKPDAPAGMDKLLFKELRHTAVTRLAEAGVQTPMIASITGHSFRTCEEIVDRYNVRTRRMADEAFKKRLAAEQPRKETN